MAVSSGQEKSSPKPIRAFIAVKLPDDVIEFLGQVQSGLKKEGLDIKGIKWVPPENIHLTLKFLGDIKITDIEAIGSAMQAAVVPFDSFTLSATGLGAFPSVKRPRVIWSGVGGEVEILARLQARLDEQLSGLGIEKESKKFKGHLTLGRIKGKVNPAHIIDAFSQCGSRASRGFVADSLYLIRSELRPKGPAYSDLLCVPMGTG